MVSSARLFYGSGIANQVNGLKAGLANSGIDVQDNNTSLARYGVSRFKKRAQSFVFIPEPYHSLTGRFNDAHREAAHDMLLSIFLFNSLLVSIQIQDERLSFATGEQKHQKPLVIFDKYNALSNPEHPFTLILASLQKMVEVGTIRVPLSNFISIAESEEELIHTLKNRRVAWGENTSHNQLEEDPEAKRVAKILLEKGQYSHPDFDMGRLFQLRAGLEHGVAIFTSAGMGDDFSAADCTKLCSGLARSNFTGVSGMGSTGHMGLAHSGFKSANGTSIGWITREVLSIENPPCDADFAACETNIYSRMFEILRHSRQIVIGAGGRGGGGTAQEFNAYLLNLFHSNYSASSVINGRTVAKPVYLDDRLGIFGPLLQMAEKLGLNQTEHMVALRGSAEIIEACNRHRAAARTGNRTLAGLAL